jgi:anti-sigma B factor antagonist
MNIRVTTTLSFPTVVIEGRFDAHETAAFREVVDSIETPGGFDIDLSETRFIDSAALSELVRAMKHAREHGYDVRLLRPSDSVSVILELTGLDLAFDVVDHP